MNNHIALVVEEILKLQLDDEQKHDAHFENYESFDDRQIMLIEKVTQKYSLDNKDRIKTEFFGFGPLEVLINDIEITEILVNSYKHIFFEKKGKLFQHSDRFVNEFTYASFIERLSQKCRSTMNREKPFIEAQYEKMRITFIFKEVSGGDSHIISIRKQPLESWTLDRLLANNWCSENQLEVIKNIIQIKKSFLVIGGTGSGKTSFIQSVLNALPENERVITIEDTAELCKPNSASVSLLTRTDPNQVVKDIDMTDLLKRALRLRPDRLVIGEIRGSEAKTLLLSLATGHDGGMSSLHAQTPHEALLRLEMLIQMGAPEWQIESIRRLIGLTLKYIIVVGKNEGTRQLNGIFEIKSVEEFGLTLQQIC